MIGDEAWRQRTRRAASMALVLAVSLAPIACSSSGGDEGASSEPAATEPAAEDPTTTTEAAVEVAESDVVGTYTKNETATELEFSAGVTSITLGDSAGAVALELDPGGEGTIQDGRGVRWELVDGEVTVYLTGFESPQGGQVAAAGAYEDGQIVGLGGPDVVWEKDS